MPKAKTRSYVVKGSRNVIQAGSENSNEANYQIEGLKEANKIIATLIGIVAKQQDDYSRISVQFDCLLKDRIACLSNK